MDIVVTGGDELYALSKRLRGADKTIRKEMLQSIRTVARPMLALARASAGAELPRSGGLAALVSKSRFSVQTTTSAGRAGVRLKAKNPHNIFGMDKGTVRHPVFGRRTTFVNQAITPNWWTGPLEAAAPLVRIAVAEAMERAANRLAEG